jgi:hypothetical protein
MIHDYNLYSDPFIIKSTYIIVLFMNLLKSILTLKYTVNTLNQFLTCFLLLQSSLLHGK